MEEEELAKRCESLSIPSGVPTFKIGRESNREGVKEMSHCLVGKVLSRKRRPAGTGEILKLPFRRTKFWVQIFNIPLVCMNMKIERMIAEIIGEVVEIPMEDRECWGKILRVKVVIDISKPLLEGLILNLEEFETSIAALIRYECLPEFCYGCGRISHPLRDCQIEEIRVKAMKGEGTQFGS
ncbi:hypothetical protein Ddye_001163 [Dipteronia dyeriana]|uniref:CCHC-type domain-containing protein n=1 Tax=Dipteronia dyeriana TaxID=168575 RepID=A0AAE0CT97_9ROSI|nr:hypothetical protein Ddye_001163 [Dipteronia dyeriana]